MKGEISIGIKMTSACTSIGHVGWEHWDRYSCSGVFCLSDLILVIALGDWSSGPYLYWNLVVISNIAIELYTIFWYFGANFDERLYPQCQCFVLLKKLGNSLFWLLAFFHVHCCWIAEELVKMFNDKNSTFAIGFNGQLTFQLNQDLDPV